VIEFTVTNGRVEHPTRRGVMLKRGFRLILFPDEYSSHAALSERLRRPGSGWSEAEARGPESRGAAQISRQEVEAESEPRAQEPEASETELLPHQRDVIRQLQRSAGGY
jgi:hypothetical protein